MRCTGTCSTAADHDGFFAQTITHILRRLRIVDAEEHLADIAEQCLILPFREALLQLTKGLVVKMKPHTISPIHIDRVIHRFHVPKGCRFIENEMHFRLFL